MEDPRPLGPMSTGLVINHHDGLADTNTLVDELDDCIYGDQDDAQSFIQPAISPMATRLTSPKTPAAEKAAAMDPVSGGGLFDELEPQTESFAMTATQTSQIQSQSQPRSTSTSLALPTPWRAGPKHMIVTEPTTGRSAMSGVFGGHSRASRSGSIGENALKRLSKALPSISIPTPSFFLSGQSQKDDPTVQAQKSAPFFVPALNRPIQPVYPLGPTNPRSPASPSPSSRMSLALRRSTSDDSLLYHSLSRVSSLGDDDRFVNIREQVNSRFKAIKDSWDGPSFKLPQFPNILNPPLKRFADLGPDQYRPNGFQSSQQRAALRDNLSPLDSVLETLTGDIVVMGGYRGSILRSSHPPYRQLWVPVKVGLNMRKVNMEVALDPEDEENMEEHIFASGMLQNIGPVDISKRLFKKLRECENARTGKLRVHDYGYDWRLSPHLLSRKLERFLERLPCNKPDVPTEKRGAWVISHSLGGLITRHVVNQRPELFAGVVYAGTPSRCINILGPIRNGDAVLLNEKVLTAQVHFSLRTSFIFLPEDGFCFVDKHTKEEYPIDFYNVDDWIKYRLSPCVSEPILPPLSRSSTFSSFLALTDSLPSLPLRARSGSQLKKVGPDTYQGHGGKDRTLAPQMGSSSSVTTSNGTGAALPAGNININSNAYAQNAALPSHTYPNTNNNDSNSSLAPKDSPTSSNSTTPPSTSPTKSYFFQQNQNNPTLAKNLTYLSRTLQQTKQFRAELAHDKSHQEQNKYPPLSLIYAKDIPTVYAARVQGREGIPCADAYDDLVFRSGDGVVLSKEAMLPDGYVLVKDGRICTDRGHVTLLGDLNAVGRALGAVVRGRGKGIGLGS
ncbi:hypothetical protein QBC37DRAFT_440087 [Rhypophila decipiens]|uniref:Uncharacterized protein n=1 Tax=Rhypophila decipiens TaxID=261697 RepID=A0AAN6Y8B4_9PEZI|nr:hypothetical protein QBC37DRAFT_440087 [Rhypophila decipiens]